jgi:Retinal pigment epithelial membrane protein
VFRFSKLDVGGALKDGFKEDFPEVYRFTLNQKTGATKETCLLPGRSADFPTIPMHLVGCPSRFCYVAVASKASKHHKQARCDFVACLHTTHECFCADQATCQCIQMALLHNRESVLSTHFFTCFSMEADCSDSSCDACTRAVFCSMVQDYVNAPFSLLKLYAAPATNFVLLGLNCWVYWVQILGLYVPVQC